MTDAATPAPLSAANIAKALGAKEAHVKKAITTLGLAPDAKKGACSLYGPEAVAKIQAALNA